MKHGEFKPVPLTSISRPPQWQYAEILEGTFEHNQATGFLHPPVVKVIHTTTEQYELLCGHTRLSNLERSDPDLDAIPCQVLKNNFSIEETLHIILEDRLISGPLSAMEKALYLKLCSSHLPQSTIVSDTLPLLDEKPQQYALKKLIELTTLEPQLQIATHTGALAPKTARSLLSVNPTDRIKLYETILFLELGGGKQQRLISLAQDLAKVHNRPIAAILEEEEITQILNHSEMNTPQKGNSLLKTLQRRLFPESSAAESEFKKRVTKMELPSNCFISHSPFFERDEVTLSVQFSTLEELEEHSAPLKTLLS